MAIFRLYFEILKQYGSYDEEEVLPFEFVVKFPNVDFNIMR
jgi:adenine-specific DNA glycosylase